MSGRQYAVGQIWTTTVTISYEAN